MNFKYLVSSIAAAALLMTGCVKEQIGGDLDQIKFEKTIMELPNKPGEVSVKMTATEAWEFNAESVLDDPETGEPWLSVSPASGAAGDFDIVFEALTSYYRDRADTVEFICGGVSQYVILNQPADPSKKPDFEDFVAGDYYIMFLEDDGGNDDASDDKYLVAMPVPQGSSYGYLNAQSAERDEEGNLTSAASNIFSFKETEGGFTIQDAYGKYYYMTGSYNSANVSATLPSSGHVWTVEQTDYYEYTITNVSNGKWMQYSTEHTSMGIYGSAQDGALMPYLVPTVAPSLIKIEQNEYTLQKVAGVLDVPAEIDGNVSVSFEADWLSYVGVKYIDGQSCLEFNYDENDGAEPRTATVLVSVSDGARVSTAELKITQRNIVELPEGLAEDGTSGDPYSVASANAIFDYDAWYRYAEDKAYFKGMVSEITTTDAAEVAQYGNVTFYISADGTEEGEQLYIFRCKYLDNQKFESLDQIQLGSEVIICGNMDVHDGTEEITDCYLYSIDGSAELPSLSVNDKSKSVDADATEVVFEYVARNLTADVTAAVASDDSKIISGEPVVDAGASTVTIALNPNTDQTEKTATVTLSANTEGIEDITLTVTQRAANTVVDPEDYSGDYWIMANDGGWKVARPLSSGYGYLYTDDAIVGQDGVPASTAANVFTVTAVDGGYTIQDAAGKYYYATDGYNTYNVTTNPSQEGNVWTISLEENDQYSVVNVATGKFMRYDPEYHSFGAYPDERGVLPTFVKADNPVVVPDPEVTHPLTSSIAWTIDNDNDKSYEQEATINGGETVKILKLGTSSKPGTSTLTIPAGTKRIGFYAVAWNKEACPMTFSGEGVSATVEPAAATGLSGSDLPYSLSISDSDYYTVDVNASAEMTITVTTGSDKGNCRGAIFGLNPVNE